MGESTDQRSYNQGRPKISDLEKLRRKVRRQEETCREMRDELDIKGWEESQPHTGPGRPKKLRQEKVFAQLMKLRKMMRELRQYEKEQGEEHKSLAEIVDPLVENNTLHAVGRRQADDLDRNDFAITKRLGQIFSIIEEIDAHGGIEPDKVKIGRPRLSRMARLKHQEKRLLEHLDFMKATEASLDRKQRISRQIKLLYDAARKERKSARLANNERLKTYHQNRNEDLYLEIKALKKYLKEVKEQQEQLGLNIEVREIEITHHFDRDVELVLKHIARIEEKYVFV